MKHADGFLLVYAIDDKKSFENISEFYEQILRVKDSDSWPAIVVVGNKADLKEPRRQVTADMVTKFIKQHQLDHFDCSALTGMNVKKSFQRTAKHVLIHKGVKLSEEVQDVNISITTSPPSLSENTTHYLHNVFSHGKLSSLEGGASGSTSSLLRRTTSDAAPSPTFLNTQMDNSATSPSFISNSAHSGKSVGSGSGQQKLEKKKCVIL